MMQGLCPSALGNVIITATVLAGLPRLAHGGPGMPVAIFIRVWLWPQVMSGYSLSRGDAGPAAGQPPPRPPLLTRPTPGSHRASWGQQSRVSCGGRRRRPEISVTKETPNAAAAGAGPGSDWPHTAPLCCGSIDKGEGQRRKRHGRGLRGPGLRSFCSFLQVMGYCGRLGMGTV